jgi:hypothetical protein
MIEHYTDLQDTWKERNARRTALIERAAADRSLFQDSKPSRTIFLRFPEYNSSFLCICGYALARGSMTLTEEFRMLNSYSPLNNEVGWAQSVDLTVVKEHYESQRRKD